MDPNALIVKITVTVHIRMKAGRMAKRALLRIFREGVLKAILILRRTFQSTFKEVAKKHLHLPHPSITPILHHSIPGRPTAPSP